MKKKCRACGKEVIPKIGTRTVARHQFSLSEPYFFVYIQVCPECGERDI